MGKNRIINATLLNQKMDILRSIGEISNKKFKNEFRISFVALVRLMFILNGNASYPLTIKRLHTSKTHIYLCLNGDTVQGEVIYDIKNNLAVPATHELYSILTTLRDEIYADRLQTTLNI